MNNDIFYQSLSFEELEHVANKTFGTDMPSDLEEISKIVNPSDSILEIGCGTGRLGAELISRGFEYTGIEKQSKYLDVFTSRLAGHPHANRFTLINDSFENFKFDKKYSVILFSWTVIGDFDMHDQEKVLKKASSLSTPKGVILIDNPSKNQAYNQKELYYPTPFYYADWKNILSDMGFHHKQSLYKTKTGVERELTILRA